MRDRFLIVLLGVTLGMGAKMLVGQFRQAERPNAVQEVPEDADDAVDQSPDERPGSQSLAEDPGS